MENIPSIADVAQICAIPLAILAIFVSWWLWRRSQRKMALTVEFQQITSPIEVKPGTGLAGDIEILYRGQPVENLFVVQARLENSGGLPITAKDFIRPITFRFEENVSFLWRPKVFDRRPDDMSGETRVSEGEPNSAELRFDLMNPGDHLSVEMICTGPSSQPKVLSGISGLEEITILDFREVRMRAERSLIILRVLAIALLITLALGTTFILQPARSESPIATSFIVATIFVALAGFLAGLSEAIGGIRRKKRE